MNVIDDLLRTVPEGTVRDVRVGAFWTAVVVEVAGQHRCGLASTLQGGDHHHYGGGPAVPDAGRLLERSARALAGLARSRSLLEASIGMAAINALLPAHEDRWVDLNAEEVLTRAGAGKRVALVGHFPFAPRLQTQVGTLWVLEQQPRGGDLPADAAPELIPQADVLAITGTTLINHITQPSHCARFNPSRRRVSKPASSAFSAHPSDCNVMGNGVDFSQSYVALTGSVLSRFVPTQNPLSRTQPAQVQA